MTPLTADDFQTIADQFKHYATVYQQIADEIRSKKLGQIDVKGVPTMNYAIERISGSVGSAQKALMNRRKINQPEPTIIMDKKESFDVSEQADKANKRATARKKKKD